MMSSESEHNQALAMYDSIESKRMAFDIAYRGKDFNNDNRTFSSEGLDKLLDHVYLFMGTRVRKEWQQKGVGPKTMRVTVNIDFNPPSESPDPVLGPDGQFRSPSIIASS